MIRSIVVNLLIGFAVLPLILFLKDLIIIKELRYFSYDYDYNKEIPYDYVRIFANEYIFREIMVLGSIFFVILTLLPFQIIKTYYYHKNNKSLKLWKKCLVLFGIISVAFVFMFRPPMTEMQERLVLLAGLLALGTFLALILYFCIDRYVERNPAKQADV